MSNGKTTRIRRPEWPALWAMVFHARNWFETGEAQREPMKWLPGSELIQYAVSKRIQRIPEQTRPDLQAAVESFLSELTLRMVPLLQADSPPTIDELRWAFDSPLLHCGRKPAGLRIVLAEERKSAEGDQVKSSLEAAEEQAALAHHEEGAEDASGHMTEELGRFDTVLKTLYGLSGAHATMILEFVYLGGVDTPAWKAHLQRRHPNRSENAHNQVLTRNKAWAVFRFLVLLMDLEEQYPKADGQVRQGEPPDALRQELADVACNADVAWRCFAFAYLTRGVTSHAAGLELGTAKLGLDDETYRAARDAVARWALRQMERRSAVKEILKKYRPRIERQVLGFESQRPESADEQ